MKRGTPDHPKMLMLAAELSIPRAHAVGLLEILWHWAAKYAIQGDIGKWKNQVIAWSAGWDKDPDKFVNSLITCGWLDEHPEARLVIHDIKDHADNTWKQNLVDAGLAWYDGSPPRKDQDVNKKDSRKPPDSFKKKSSSPPQPEPEPEPEPEPIKSALPRADSTQLCDRFQDFWDAYPNQINHEDAAHAWVSLCGKVITEQNIHEVFEGLDRYKRSRKWAEEDGKYIPSPKTFLMGNEKKRGGMWKDRPAPADGFERPAYDGSSPYAIYQPPEGVL